MSSFYARNCKGQVMGAPDADTLSQSARVVIRSKFNIRPWSPRPGRLPELGVRLNSQANCAHRESSLDARQPNRPRAAAGERETSPGTPRDEHIFEKMRRRIHTEIIAGRCRKNLYIRREWKKEAREHPKTVRQLLFSLLAAASHPREISIEWRQRTMNFVLRPASTFPAKQSLRLLLLDHEGLFIYAQLRPSNEMRALPQRRKWASNMRAPTLQKNFVP